MNTTQNKVYALLRKTERFTKTDMVYLASGGFWLFLKTVVTALVAFGISVAFANLLPKTTYGEYKYVFSIFGLLAIFTLTGMGTAATKSVAQGFDGTFLVLLKKKIHWGVVGSIISAFIAMYYAVHGNYELAGAFGLTTIFLPFVDTLSTYNAVLTGKKLFRLSTVYEVTVQIITACIIVGTLFVTNNLLIVLGSYFVAYTTLRFIIFKLVLARNVTNNNVDPGASRYGKHLSAMNVLSTVAEAIDNILLWQFIGPASLAVYAFAKGVPAQISSALQRITTLAFPKFAQRDFKEIKRALPFRMGIMLVIMIIIVGLYILAAPFIFNFFFPAYTDAIVYSQLMALTLLFFPQKFIGVAFQAHARTKALYISNTIVPIVRSIVAIALIPFFGIMGAIVTEFIGRIINLIILTFLFFRTES